MSDIKEPNSPRLTEIVLAVLAATLAGPATLLSALLLTLTASGVLTTLITLAGRRLLSALLTALIFLTILWHDLSSRFSSTNTELCAV